MTAPKNDFDTMIARYGMPHLWGPFERWINMWRLITEWINIRIVADVATCCPDEGLRAFAQAKLGAPSDSTRIDEVVPGKGAFVYDWDVLCREYRSRNLTPPEVATR